MEKEDLMEKEVKLKSRKNHKGFLVLVKYVYHFLAFIYACNTFLQFIGIDVPEIGCFFHVALLPWVIFIVLSYKLRFCYVHRLPLYYIAINELITNVDYYIGIPISESNLLICHLLIASSLIFGYSYYYKKCKLNTMRDRRKFGRPRVLRYPKTGDIVTSLKNGESLVVSPKDFERVRKFFKINTFFKSSSNTNGNIKAISKKFEKEAYFTPAEYNEVKNDFELSEVVGSKKNPFNWHEYVDLGLPSGTLWATMNVGASTVTGTGTFYKYGEITTYDGTNYNISAYTDTVTTKLPLENDAANANWGGNWYIPTKTLWDELVNNTTHTYIDDYNSTGVAVFKFAKTNDSSTFIIIPATGSYENGVLKNPDVAYYWASTQRYGSAEYTLFTDALNFYPNWGGCAYGHGMLVRAVCDNVNVRELASEGDIVCYNLDLNITSIFTYSDWLNLYNWDAIDLFGIETFDEDDEVTEERYIILANGETFIIKASDYSKVSSQWEHVDTIPVPQIEDNQNP